MVVGCISSASCKHLRLAHCRCAARLPQKPREDHIDVENTRLQVGNLSSLGRAQSSRKWLGFAIGAAQRATKSTARSAVRAITRFEESETLGLGSQISQERARRRRKAQRRWRHGCNFVQDCPDADVKGRPEKNFLESVMTLGPGLASALRRICLSVCCVMDIPTCEAEVL